MSKKQVASVDEYLQGVPEDQRAALERLRAVIKAAAPNATEKISYQMPTFNDHGPLVAFAAFKDHLSFFVMSTAVMDAHREELEPYRAAKGTLYFQPGRPLPNALVKKLVKAKLEENKKGMKGRGPTVMRARHPMPDDIKQELERTRLMDAYHQRPPYQQNDYIGWITQAKQKATRQKRLEQMVDELERGDVYMKMAYKPKGGKSKVP